MFIYKLWNHFFLYPYPSPTAWPEFFFSSRLCFKIFLTFFSALILLEGPLFSVTIWVLSCELVAKNGHWRKKRISLQKNVKFVFAFVCQNLATNSFPTPTNKKYTLMAFYIIVLFYIKVNLFQATNYKSSLPESQCVEFIIALSLIFWLLNEKNLSVNITKKSLETKKLSKSTLFTFLRVIT